MSLSMHRMAVMAKTVNNATLAHKGWPLIDLSSSGYTCTLADSCQVFLIALHEWALEPSTEWSSISTIDKLQTLDDLRTAIELSE